MVRFIVALIFSSIISAAVADVPTAAEIKAIAVTCETPTERGVKCKPKTPVPTAAEIKAAVAATTPTCKTGTALTYNEKSKTYTCEKAWSFTGTDSNGMTVGNTNNLTTSFSLSGNASMVLEQSGRIVFYGPKGKLVVIETDGTAKLYGKPNEAARIFWDIVARYRQDCRNVR